MRQWLTKGWVLWTLFILQILIGASFGLIMGHWDFQLIDSISDPAKASAVIAGLTDMQRTVHIWTTATLDVAYPLAYGGLFAGLALRFLGKAGKWLSLPAFAAIPADVSEGVVQVLALTGTEGVIGAKAILTPLKFGLFMVAALIALLAVIVAIINIFRKPKKETDV